MEAVKDSYSLASVVQRSVDQIGSWAFLEAPCRKAMSRRYNVFCSVGEDHRNDYKVNGGLVIVEHVTGSRRLSICVVAARHH